MIGAPLNYYLLARMVDMDGVRGSLDMLLCCVAMVMVGMVRWIDDLNGMRRESGGRGTCNLGFA